MEPETYNLDFDGASVFNWSLFACASSLVSTAIIIPSIFEDKYIYVMNIIWILWDYAAFIFTFIAGFYDDTAFYLAALDAMLFLLFLLLISYLILRYNVAIGFMGLCCIICCSVIFLPVIIYLIGTMSMMLLCYMLQESRTDIIPYCNYMFIDHPDYHQYWTKYRIYKWIKSGKNHQEIWKKICVANIVSSDRKIDHDINTDLREMIRNSNKAANNINFDMMKRILQDLPYQELDFKPNKFNPSIRNLNLDDNKNYKRRGMYLFSINRIIHFIWPIVIGLYILSQEGWIVSQINAPLKYCGYLVVVLYILSIASVICTWISLKYHRLLVPYWNKLGDTKLNETMTDIANCHSYITIFDALLSYCGNKDVAEIILEFIAPSSDEFVE